MAHESWAYVQKKVKDLKAYTRNMIKAYRLYLKVGDKERARARLASLNIQAIEKKIALICNKNYE